MTRQNGKQGSKGYSVSQIAAPPLREQPGYRAQEVPRDCSTMELVAAVVGGPRQGEIAGELVGRFGDLDRLASASKAELTAVTGLGDVGVGRLKAGLELGRRRTLPRPERGARIRCPGDAARLLMADIGLLEQREVHVLYLNRRNRLLGRERVYKGTFEKDWARTCELLRGAVARNCAAIIVARNEPDVPLEVDSVDALFARRLNEAGEFMDIEVMDGLIGGRDSFVSLREGGLGFDAKWSGAKRRKRRNKKRNNRKGAKVDTIMVPASALVTHQAQMRTRMDIDEMAQLTVQVYQRGISEHQPILAADNGDGTYRIVSGHRRKLAALFAAEVKSRNGKGRPRVEQVRRLILEFAKRNETVVRCHCGGDVRGQSVNEETGAQHKYCDSCGGWVEPVEVVVEVFSPSDLPLADGALCEKHGKVEVPVVLFEGSKKDEILALQASNFGQETPDLLGQAKSYAAARGEGATESEIAANCGETTGHVKAVLTLNKVPEALAEAIAAGDAPLGLAVAIAKLKKGQMTGVTQYVLDHELNVERTQRLVKELSDWTAPGLGLDAELLPHERNEARVEGAVWGELVTN
ncbi:MAG: hypothetical protein E3J64_00785, partial [Anaerolineales bacterium]